MQARLAFLIGSPRSGSTLLARMLGAHSSIHTPDEPHLLTPLAHLGYYGRVEKAPYDPFITEAAMRALVAQLPRGEEDYLDALRGLTDTLYERLLAPTGRTILLDKTPAYALVLDFVARLYPTAHYIVLTRHPMAVWSSYVDSFFDGDHEAAHAHNPLLERYVPAIARFVRDQPVPFAPVRYETLVQQPEEELQRLCAHLGVPYEPGMVNYGGASDDRARPARGLGDPMTVAWESRPTTRSLSKWQEEFGRHPGRVEQARRILDRLVDEDLAVWGVSREQVEAELHAISPAPSRRRRWNRHTVERMLLVRLRRNIHHNAFGRLVRRIRLACDVLLR